MKFRKLLLVASTALTLGGAAPRSADAAPLAALIPGIASLGTFGSAIVGAAFSIGANWLIQKIFTDEPKPQGVKQRLESGGDNPISFIVGYYSTPGKLIYVNSYEEDNQSLIMVVNLSEVPVTALSSKIVINGKVCDIDFGNQDSAGFDKITQYQKGGRNYCSVKFVNDPNSAPNYLTTTFGSDPIKPWQNDMIGRGCSYAIIYFGFSTDGIWAGIPNVKFVVKGIPMYDPRKDSSVGGSGPHRYNDRSTYEYSENCSVINYNIARGIRYGGKKIYGGNATAAQLPLDIWTAAMNACDVNVALKAGGNVKRYTMGAEISVDLAPMDVIREIDNSSNGYTFEYGGIWKTFVGGPGASVTTISDDNIVITSEQTDDLFKPLQETYNVAQGSYPEPNACWEQKDAPTIYFDDLIAEDGEELSINMEFPYVFEKNQVQRLMRAAVKDSRRQRVHTIELPPPYATLEAFDVITWNSARNGYVNKKFMILQKDDLPNVNQVLVIREIDPDDYTWTTIMELDSEVASLDTDEPDYSKDFTVAASQIDTPAGGKDRPAVYTTWAWAAYDLDVRDIQWEARYVGGTKVQAFGSFSNYRDGLAYVTHDNFKFGQTVEIRFRVRPVSKRRSDWTSWKTVTFAVFDIPAAPTLVARFDTAADGTNVHYLVVSWTNITAQTSTYKVNVNDGTDDRVYDSSSSPAKIPVTSGVTYTVKVAGVDSAGTQGAYSSTTSLLIPAKSAAPTTPAGLTANGGHRRATLAWTESTDKDYKRTDIYRSTTNDFTTAVVVGSVHGKAFADTNLALSTTYYYWIIHVDRTGNLSAKFPVSNTAGVAASTTYVADADTDPTAPSAPGGLTLTQLPRDLDGDGKIDIGFKAAWSSVAGAKWYEIEVTQGSDVYYVTTKNRSVMIPAKSGFLYSVKVSTITFNGTASTFSSAVTLTPVSKSALVVAPTSLAVSPGTKRNRLKWSESTEKDYKRTRIYRSPNNTWASAVLLDSVAGTAFVDDNLTTGVTYYYYVAHVDQTGNVSAVFPSNAGAGVSGVPSVTAIADLPLEPSQIISNPTFTGGSNDGWDTFDPTYTFVRAKAFAGVPADAPADYVVEFNTATYATDAYWKTWTPVEPGEVYYVEGLIENDGLCVDNFILGVHFKNINLSANSSWVTGYLITAAQGNALTTWTKFSALVTVPTTISSVRTGFARGWFSCRGNASPAGKWYGTKFRMRKATEADMIAAGAVTDIKTDQTPPGTPSAPTLATLAADIDGDGSVDTGLTVSITAPSGVKVIAYEVQKYASSTLGGSYTAKGERFQIPAEDPNTAGTVTTFDFKANQSKFWKLRARAISFSGKKGSWSALTTTGVQPNGYSASLNATAPSVTQVANGYRYTWTKPTDKAYKETEILVNGVALIRLNGTAYTDTTSRTIGDTPSITVRHFDRSDNVGTTSSATVAPAYRVASVAELPEEPSNIIMNPNFRGGMSDGWTLPGTHFVRAKGHVNVPANAPTDYVLEMNGNAVSPTDAYWTQYVAVEPNEVYYVEAVVEADAVLVHNFTLGLHFKDIAMNGGTNSWLAGVSLSAAQGIALTGWTKISGLVTVPATVSGVRTGFARLWTSAVNNASPAGRWFITKIRVRKATESDMVANGAITDAKTDQTAPATPGAAPTMTGLTADIDKDGTLDTGFSSNIPAPVSGVPVKYWEVEVQEATAIGTSGSLTGYAKTGTNILVKAEAAGNTYVEIIGKAQRWYKFRYRGISFSGKEGGWSAYTNAGAQPGQYNSMSGVTPSAPTVVQHANAFRVSWTASSDPTYAFTEVLAAGSPVGRTNANYFDDNTSRTLGATVSYTYKHYDKQGNPTNASGATVSPAFRALTTSELNDAAVIARKADLGDTTNLVKANDMTDVTLFTAAAVGSATGVSITSLPNTSTTLGAAKNKLRVSFTTTAAVGDGVLIATTAINPCEEGKRYTFSAYANGVTNATLINIKLAVDWYTLDASGVPVFLATSTNSDTLPTGTVGRLQFSETTPATAAFFVVVITAVTIVGIANARVIDIGTITARLANNVILEYDIPSGSQTVGAGNTAQVMTLTSHHTKGAGKVVISFAFKNASSGTRAISVIWQKVNTVSGTTTLLTQNVSMQDDNLFYMEFIDDNLAGDDTAYNCRITAPAGNSFVVTGRIIKTEAILG